MEALAASPVFGFKTSRSLKLSRPNFTLPGFTHLSCTGYKGSTSNFGTFLSWSPKSCSIFASADIPIMVVAFQAAMEIMAQEFPGAFAGYKLKVTESHQSSKVDTSGTARAIVASFNKLGVSFKDEEIEMVRNPPEQISRMEVPEEHLRGHAFHTYSLASPDGMVNFKFQHNVCGRSIYAQGTVDAVLFLARKVQEKATKKVYNMVDVLRGGSMR
ncbi:hypothetical protein L7F22_061784 [Adiantum nelumboides]|nr:hypothetical protein [Adiantum nelumboides]